MVDEHSRHEQAGQQPEADSQAAQAATAQLKQDESMGENVRGGKQVNRRGGDRDSLKRALALN